MLDKPRELAHRLNSRIDSRLDAVADLPPPPVFLSVQKAIAMSVPTQVAVCASVSIHLFLILAVGATILDPKNFMPPHNALDVVLVNAKSATKPIKADALAQANLDGGGNTDEARRAKTPLPAVDQSAAKNEKMAQQHVKQLEQEVKTLMTQAKSSAKVLQGEMNQQPSGTPAPSNPAELLQQSMEIKRLEAELSRAHEAYQQRPKRAFVGGRTTEYRFARFVENWRLKIERVGNLNYPEEAKRTGLQGQLQLTVAIKSNGEVEDIKVERSSGSKTLDQAAKRIVMLSAPFDRFPDSFKNDTDILHITRTWIFGRDETLTSK
ncbi:MAG: TonB family protein [Usitatibacteraceae bacterium]